MANFKTLLQEALRIFSNQWFGACIKLPNSREPLKFQNTYDITKPRLLKSRDFGALNH